MTLTDRAILEITGDVDGDGADETGVFEFGPADEGAFRIEERIETNYLLNGQFDQVSSIVEELFTDGEQLREGIYADLGGGIYTIELDFQNPGDVRDENGDLYQWGASADSDVRDETSATGADRITQGHVLMNYFRSVLIGSKNPMRLQWGEYSPDGMFDDHLNVVPESPSTVIDNTNTAKWDGGMVLRATQDLSQVLDGAQQVLG